MGMFLEAMVYLLFKFFITYFVVRYGYVHFVAQERNANGEHQQGSKASDQII